VLKRSLLISPFAVTKSPSEGFTEALEGICAQVMNSHFIMGSEMNLKFQLEYYLQRHSITPTMLARLAKVPRQNISNWLMNQKPKDVEQVKRVADVFQISLDHLLFGNAKDSQTTVISDSKDWITGTFEIKIRKIK
jgi:hypothetical protein